MNDENILRIPITLKKRTPEETKAYFEGFLAGLVASKSAIEKSIENYETTYATACKLFIKKSDG
jgi:hypothetical protein